MPPKPEPTPAPAPATPAPAPAAAAAPSKIAGLIPVILVVILAPVISWAVAQYVLLPKMEQRLAAAVGKVSAAHAEPVAPEPAAAAAESAGGHGAAKGGKKSEEGASNSYEFSNVVVNLAGTMGTRYLKVTFVVTGKDPTIRNTFNKDKAKLVDITLNVLSSLSLADLEEAGSKNIIREKLVNAYNQAFGKKTIDQIYFSDFVVQ